MIHVTATELDILLCIAEGLTDAEIAAKRGTKTKTAATQVAVLRAKFGARNRAHMISLAYHEHVLLAPSLKLESVA